MLFRSDPWSKEDYSWHVQEASMAVEKLPEVNPPSGRVLGRGLPRYRSWKHCGSRTMEKFAIPESLGGFPHGTLNIGQSRALEEVRPTQVTSWRGLGPGRANRSPGRPLAALWPIFGDLEASVSLIFFIFFVEFFGLRKIG